MSMKVIFLDVDGVLNNDEFLGDVDRSHETDWTDFWRNNLNPKLVEKLNQIIDKTGAVVVISSSWRLAMNIDDAREILNTTGFRGQIIGYTPYLKEASRGTEIMQWLDTHETTRFIILDDVDDMGVLSCCLIKTDVSIGLTAEDVDRAIRLLN